MNGIYQVDQEAAKQIKKKIIKVLSRAGVKFDPPKEWTKKERKKHKALKKELLALIDKILLDDAIVKA